MEISGSIVIVLLVLLGYIEDACAVYCGFRSQTGTYQFTFCMEKCCPGNNLSYDQVCCRYSASTEVFVGAGLAAVILVALFVLCIGYMCCKKRWLSRNTATEIRHSDARTGPTQRRSTLRNVDEIPTVSLQVDPPVPPAYNDIPPPPYCLHHKLPQELIMKEQYPDEPPPKYSRTIEDNKPDDDNRC